MSILSKIFGGKKQGVSQAPSTMDEPKIGETKMKIKITHSTKKLAEISSEFSVKSAKGEILPPQLWMLMMNGSQAKMLITKFATPAENMFAQSPEIVNLPDGKALVCFTLKDAGDIRKLVDTLTNAVRIECTGFIIQLPESDRSYVLRKLGASGEVLKIGKVITFS